MADLPKPAVHANIREKPGLNSLKGILAFPLSLPWRGRRFCQRFQLEIFMTLSCLTWWEYLSALRDVNPHYAREAPANYSSRTFYLDWNNDVISRNNTSSDVVLFPFKYYLYSESGGDYELVHPFNVSDLRRAEIFPNGTWYVNVHGYYMNSSHGPITAAVAQALKELGEECNVLAPDYEALMLPPHYEDVAYGHAQFVGEKLAELLHHLIQVGVAKLEKIHLVGYSSGAPAAGIAGMFMQKKYGLKLKRITGLCPSTVYFEFYHSRDDVLDRTDAEYVDIFHAAATTIGIWKPVGHVDYYINGGKPHQPNCGKDEFTHYYLCSHTWARIMFQSSFNITLIAKRSESWESFVSGNPIWNSSCAFRLRTRCPDGIYLLEGDMHDMDEYDRQNNEEE